jgi:hypothetical protein
MLALVGVALPVLARRLRPRSGEPPTMEFPTMELPPAQGDRAA